MSPAPGGDAVISFTASGIAAIINFPLWRASAIAQAGYKVEGSNFIVQYMKAVFQPPFKGVAATMIGMTWARAAIFYGSDIGKAYMLEKKMHPALAQMIPPLIMGTFVQVVNMPLVRYVNNASRLPHLIYVFYIIRWSPHLTTPTHRATITIQNPSSELVNVREALKHIYAKGGISGLWHGVSAGIMKVCWCVCISAAIALL
jgi:hypothetical protein